MSQHCNAVADIPKGSYITIDEVLPHALPWMLFVVTYDVVVTHNILVNKFCGYQLACKYGVPCDIQLHYQPFVLFCEVVVYEVFYNALGDGIS